MWGYGLKIRAGARRMLTRQQTHCSFYTCVLVLCVVIIEFNIFEYVNKRRENLSKYTRVETEPKTHIKHYYYRNHGMRNHTHIEQLLLFWTEIISMPQIHAWAEENIVYTIEYSQHFFLNLIFTIDLICGSFVWRRSPLKSFTTQRWRCAVYWNRKGERVLIKINSSPP